LALCVYEYLITFEHELRIVWQGRITVTSVIFLLNRWVMMLPEVITLMFDLMLPPTTQAVRNPSKISLINH
ncbi:hypothetical protein PHLGIDRAFT_68927, partial [Phlebiopsis gigantea 11061_1 CR5-6]